MSLDVTGLPQRRGVCRIRFWSHGALITLCSGQQLVHGRDAWVFTGTHLKWLRDGKPYAYTPISGIDHKNRVEIWHVWGLS